MPIRVRVGFSVALLALIGVCEGIGLSCYQVQYRRLAIVCLSIGVIGLLTWIAAGCNQGERRKDRIDAEHPLLFLKSLKYWSLMVVFSAGIACILGDFTAPAKPIIVRARQKEPAPAPSPKASLPAPVSFPPLKLQGVIIQGSRSSALINGQVLRVGEEISRVRVVAIGHEQVTVELRGETTVLRLKSQ